MIQRTFSPQVLNDAANDPDVRPYLGFGSEELDLSPLILDVRNVAIETKGGGWLFHQLEPGIYELHTMLKPMARGFEAFEAMREALRYVFCRTDAIEVVTKCPKSNRPACVASAIIGFKERFSRENAWEDGSAVSYRAMTIEEWALTDETCPKQGEKFHKKLDQLGATPNHAHDVAHDRIAGAAWLIIKAGLFSKGVDFYNRWARFAGYQQIQAIAPGVVDIRDAILELKGDDFALLKR